MSKIFYDHLLELEKLDKEIKLAVVSEEEKHELWQIMDETIHHRVMGCILDNLPQKHHDEFLEKFHTAPHDPSLAAYLTAKIGKNVEELIKQEIGELAFEILHDSRSSKK